MNGATSLPAPHLSVLYQEVLNMLQPVSPGHYVDGTLGAGGHAFGILQASAPHGELLGLDLDPTALAIAKERLAEFSERAHLVRASYTTLSAVLKSIGWMQVNGVLLDLGVSSMQLDQSAKGFSFSKDAPIDMRFDPSAPLTGAELVNGLPEEELSRILWEFGEERMSRKIARVIVANRPITQTIQLADVIVKAIGRHPGSIHPATRTFQAIRIAVNDELSNLSSVLPQAISVLTKGGRLAVISFHSLEDRIVKHTFVTESKDCICPPEQLVCTCGHQASVKILTRHPIEASEEEKKSNPRARSARLRVVEKI